MTNKERENVLHCLKVMAGEELCEECNLYGTTGTDHCETDCVRLAIQALEKEECEDAISRKNIIEQIKEAQNRGYEFTYESLIDFVKALPPELSAITECDDAISREDVKRILAERCDVFRKVNIDDALFRIESLPSVQPVRKAGKWIGTDEEPHLAFECSECGCSIEFLEKPDLSHYCPDCGAKMTL